MLKFEWPLIVPDNAAVKALAEATFDIDEYIIDIAKKEGIAEGVEPSRAAPPCISLATRGHRISARNRLRCSA